MFKQLPYFCLISIFYYDMETGYSGILKADKAESSTTRRKHLWVSDKSESLTVKISMIIDIAVGFTILGAI